MAGSNASTAANKNIASMRALDRVKIFWATRNSSQRLYLGIGAAITLAAAALFAQTIASPDYKPLISGLEPADAQTLSAQLSAKKIPFIVAPDGTSISVPAGQIDAARLEVSSHDSPHSGRMGFEIFDKVSWGQTEFDEKVNYQRALEGELERTIQTMSNIKSARVHLVMATDSVFMDRERGAKASVTLRLRRGSLSREELSAITHLVAGAVDELKPGDVAIVDADSNHSLAASSSSTGSNDEVEQGLTRRLVATLAPVVGAEGIHATVNVEYETGSSEESQEKYDPAVSVPLNMQRSEENTAAGAAIGGVPGTSSNVAKAKPAIAPSPKDPGQSSKTEAATYGVNRTTRHVIEPAGRIRRLTAAVLVDDAIERKQEKGKWVETYKKRSPEDLKLITELAQAAIGFSTVRGDLISVQNLTFDHAASVDAPAVTFVEKARKGFDDYAAFVRYAALFALFALVYMLMIRPIQKRALAAPDAALLASLSPARLTADNDAPDSASSLAQRSLALKKQLTDFIQTEPETSTVAVRAWLREGAK
ncbi:MAG: flagellar M-ring protein FliF [Acidobacteriota bacterium]|nr:flagellar M-ring protein FliF [Acidobacteriota bacterium]